MGLWLGSGRVKASGVIRERDHTKRFMNSAAALVGLLSMRHVKNIPIGGYFMKVLRNILSAVIFPQSIASEYMLYIMV